jgi:hypothetical protein
MARARGPTTRAGRSRPASRRARPAPRPTEAETRLLALARELDRLPLEDAVRALAAAHGPAEPLPRAVYRAWLRSRGDKAAALALAWAREQLRLALRDALGRAGGSVGTRLHPQDEHRAWILLAAAEALAHEPPAAVADRLRAILGLLAPAPREA